MAILLISPFILAVAPALIVPLALYGLVNIPVGIKAIRRISYQELRRLSHKCRLIAWAVSGVIILFGIYELCQITWFQFWVSVITGNWTSDQSVRPKNNLVFSLSIIAAILLNLGPWLYIISQVRKILTLEQEMAMELAQALALKDALTKKALSDELGDNPAALSVIDSAFEAAENNWRRTVVRTFGRQAAAKFFEALDEDAQRPPRSRPSRYYRRSAPE